MSRRAVILVLIALVLGAMTTIAIAWGIASSRPNGSGAMGWGSGVLFETGGILCGGSERRLRGQWFFALDGTTNAGTADQFRASHSQLGTQVRTAESIPTWVRLPSVSESTPRSRQFCSNAYGWPLLSLHGTVLEATRPSPTDPTAHMTMYEDYWVIGHRYDPGARTLPLGIIWPGFLINTFTFAAAWFVLLFAAHRATSALITRRRLCRGTCPMCRYDLRGDFSSGCHECGWNRITKKPS